MSAREFEWWMTLSEVEAWERGQTPEAIEAHANLARMMLEDQSENGSQG